MVDHAHGIMAAPAQGITTKAAVRPFPGVLGIIPNVHRSQTRVPVRAKALAFGIFQAAQTLMGTNHHAREQRVVHGVIRPVPGMAIKAAVRGADAIGMVVHAWVPVAGNITHLVQANTIHHAQGHFAAELMRVEIARVALGLVVLEPRLAEI